jgi:hypothetical protein
MRCESSPQAPAGFPARREQRSQPVDQVGGNPTTAKDESEDGFFSAAECPAASGRAESGWSRSPLRARPCGTFVQGEPSQCAQRSRANARCRDCLWPRGELPQLHVPAWSARPRPDPPPPGPTISNLQRRKKCAGGRSSGRNWGTWSVGRSRGREHSPPGGRRGSSCFLSGYTRGCPGLLITPVRAIWRPLAASEERSGGFPTLTHQASPMQPKKIATIS